MCLNQPRHCHLPPATWRVRTGRAVRICHSPPSEFFMQRNINRIKICAKINKTPAKTFLFVVFVCMLKNAYGDESMSQTCVFEAHEKFLGGQEHVQDDELLGRPSTSHTDAMLKILSRLSIRAIALAEPYVIWKHGFVTRVHSQQLPLTYKTFLGVFFLFLFEVLLHDQLRRGKMTYTNWAPCVLTLQVAGGKWWCLGRFKHIPHSNPRPQRPAGSASLGHGSPIPGTYYTNPVRLLKNHFYTWRRVIPSLDFSFLAISRKNTFKKPWILNLSSISCDCFACNYSPWQFKYCSSLSSHPNGVCAKFETGYARTKKFAIIFYFIAIWLSVKSYAEC